MVRRQSSQLQATAYHEAGHAVYAFRSFVRIKRISIEPKDDYVGQVRHGRVVWGNPELSTSNRTRSSLERAIQISLAGQIAQRRFNARSVRTWQARSDHQCAVDLALRCCGSGRTATAFLKYLTFCVEDALFAPINWRLVEALAKELLTKKVMNGKEAEAFLLAQLGCSTKSIKTADSTTITLARSRVLRQ
jgi:hypothetical protein